MIMPQKLIKARDIKNKPQVLNNLIDEYLNMIIAESSELVEMQYKEGLRTREEEKKKVYLLTNIKNEIAIIKNFKELIEMMQHDEYDNVNAGNVIDYKENKDLLAQAREKLKAAGIKEKREFNLTRAVKQEEKQ